MTVDDDKTLTRTGAFMIGGTAIQQQNSNQNKQITTKLGKINELIVVTQLHTQGDTEKLSHQSL